MGRYCGSKCAIIFLEGGSSIVQDAEMRLDTIGSILVMLALQLQRSFCGPVGYKSDSEGLGIELRACLVPQNLENDLPVCMMEALLAWIGCKGAAIVYQMQC